MELRKHFITASRTYVEGAVEVFQQSFSCKTIENATLTITALGLYEAEINGQKVGNYLFTPGYTYYPREVQYEVYDVKELLKAENKLKVYLAQGWYCGRFLHENRQKVYGEQSAVSWVLEIEQMDGTVCTYCSDDDTVQGIKSPYEYAGFYDGEVYWADGGYTEPLAPVRYTGKIPEYWCESTIHIQVQEEMPVKKVINSGDVTILDFGQNFAGIIEIDPSKMNGDSLKLRHGEILKPDGTLYTDNLRKAKAEIIYHKGVSSEKYSPRFTYMGFRYVELSGCNYEEGLLCARVLHTQMIRTGFFTCENKKLQRLYENQLWSQRANYMDVPTDCPQRDERMGYPGDGQAFAATGAYNYDTEAFWDKFFRDIHYSQMDNHEGYVGPVIPAPGPAGVGFLNMLGWGNAVTILPELMYRQYGEEKYLVQMYENMKSHVECEIRHMGGLLGRKNLWIAPNLGDWLSPKGDIKYMAMHNGPVSNAFIVNDLRILSELSARLGKAEDAERYNVQLKKTRAAYIKAFVKKDGSMKDDYQGAYVMALEMVIPRGDLWNRMFAHLVEKLKAEGIGTGFFATAYLLPMLVDHGEQRLAFDLLFSEDCPGWLYQVNRGATTIWERWDAIRPNGTVNETGNNGSNMVSFNHFAFGSVGRFFYEYILGIQPLEPGFAKVRIRPYFDARIGAFSGRYLSRQGEIAVAYENGQLQVTVPVEAEIILPNGSAHNKQPGKYTFSLS